MAISVNFGYTPKDNRYIEKNPVWTQENISCEIYEPVDRLNPVLIVDVGKVDFTDTNYMYIPEFGRYYFITGISGTAAKTVAVSGHVDVLMTYKDDIMDCKCIGDRSSNQVNLYLHDPRRLYNAYVENSYFTLGDLGLPDKIVLMTLGQ